MAPFTYVDADDTFKILLATDNHIGYNERDPIRGQDSINTFREILQLAVKNEVHPLPEYVADISMTDAYGLSRSISSYSLETFFTRIDRLEIVSTKSWASCENIRWAPSP